MNDGPFQTAQSDTVSNTLARLAALYAEAKAFVPSGRIDGLMRQWLKTTDFVPSKEHANLISMLATELALFTQSTLGSTAFDRLARTRMPRAPEDIALLTAMRAARYRIIEYSAGQWRDVASNKTLRLHPGIQATPASGTTLLCLVARMQDGSFLVPGTAVLMDQAAMAVARGFIRPGGRGLSNPVRCAELVFRHLLQSGLITFPAPNPTPRPPPFDAAHDPIDALAAEWAGRQGGLEEKDQAHARVHTGLANLINTLARIVIARETDRSELSAAYAQIALIMTETFVIRNQHGSGGLGLDQLAAEIAIQVLQRGLPSRVRDEFHKLRARVKVSAAPGRSNDSDLDRLVQRIRGLRAKTVEQGCTEQEALSAAEKVAELLDRYGLTINELELRRQSCEGVGIETGRKRRGPIDDCMPVIARFFDCRVWTEISTSGTLRYIFFGLPADVQAAVYLHDLIVLAFETETRSFQGGAIYDDTPSARRRTATNSFQIGLARGISGKLEALRAARDASRRNGSGRDLVPIKKSIIDNELEKLGLRFQQKSTKGRRSVLTEAFAAGKDAGERFDYRPAISGQSVS
jgi:hypothetical protein